MQEQPTVKRYVGYKIWNSKYLSQILTDQRSSILSHGGTTHVTIQFNLPSSSQNSVEIAHGLSPGTRFSADCS